LAAFCVYSGIVNLDKAKVCASCNLFLANLMSHLIVPEDLRLYCRTCPPRPQAALDLQSRIVLRTITLTCMRHLRTQALRRIQGRIRPHLGHSDVGSVRLNQGISFVSTCQILIILTSPAKTSTLKYAQLRDVESIRAITCAHQTLDLAAEPMVRNYREELSSAPTIRSHLTANLLCLVELYSTIRYVAQAKYTTNSSRACLVWADFCPVFDGQGAPNSRVHFKEHAQDAAQVADATRLSLSRWTRSMCPSARRRQAASRLLANEENAVMVWQESS
jgi:hypothetical protein